MSWAMLRAKYPWPKHKPDVPPKMNKHGEPFGWFNGQNRHILKTLLGPDTCVVLELGALLGLSTRYLAQYAPHAAILTIDHWKGSREHQKFEQLADVIDKLYEVFCVHVWEYRDHIIPMKTRTLEGMIDLHDASITPELIYIDASHETGPVYADTAVAMALWPEAHIVGDDGGWKSIQAAHRDLRFNTDRTIINYGCCWEIPPSGAPATWPEGLKAKK